MAASRVVEEMSEEEVKLELTPMIDVSFLILIFFMCLPFKTLEGKLQAFLPTDKGINPTPQEPPLEIKVSVHIVARKEQPGMWGPKDLATQVMKPTEFLYRFGDQEKSDLKEVEQYIKNAYKAAEGTENTKVLGEIKAGHKVPHKYVVAVLNKFAAAGMEKVDFYGTAIPKPDLRKLDYLPYPTKNYVTSD
jgi:biopolymer transport protein ExbD